MSEYVYAGLTSQTIDLFIRDSSSATGQGLTGLAYNTSNFVASYRKGATGSRTAITLATQTVGGAFSSGGFVEIDATNMPGCYRFDLPNAAVDTAGFVTFFLKGAANMVPVALRIDCRPIPADIKQIGADTQSATDLKDFADAGYDPSTNKVNAALDSASLIRFVTEDTGQTSAADGSVAKLSQGSGGAGAVTVLPATGIVADRSAGTTLLPVIGETISQAITVYQSDGTTAVDLSGKTLKIIFETLGGVDVAVVSAADISIGGTNDNVVTFAYPSAVTASERTLRFAIRDAAAPLTMYLQGVCSVVSAPKVDA
jgi:hypothetical protein